MPTDTPISIGARRVVTAGLVLAMAVVALEVTVVTTALPTIVGEFDRLDLYAWVFSAYLLTSTVAVPLCGKLADLFGRRRVFLAGMILFLVGSILCGLARGMGELILYRAIQGLGAGAVMPTIFTILADVYRLEERARVQGLFSGLWGVTSLLGPALGAWLTLAWSWRAVFFIGVPFGLGGAVLLWLFFQERVERRRVALDLTGSALLTLALVLLLVAMTQGGVAVSWGSLEMIGLLGVTAALFGAFVLVELRAEDPVLPLSLFGLRIFSASQLCNFLSGAVLFGVTSYVPLYVQGVYGEDASGAGAALTPMLFAWAVSGLFGPRLLIRFGFRPVAIGSTALIALGAAGVAVVGATGWRPLLYLGVTLMGLGFGPSMAAFVMSVQEAVPWGLRGVATSSTQLFRSLGGAVGVALMGALLQLGLRTRLAAIGMADTATNALLDPQAHASLPPDVLTTLQVALGDALLPVLTLTMLFAIVTLAAALAFAHGELGQARRRAPSAASAPSPAGRGLG